MAIKLPSAEDLAQLRAKHGAVHVLKNDYAAVVARKPTREEYRRMRRELADPNVACEAQENLMHSIVVWPDAAGFEALLDEYPAFADNVAKQLTPLLGASASTDAKKV